MKVRYALIAAALVLASPHAHAADAPPAAPPARDPDVHYAPLPESSLTYHVPTQNPTLPWALLQLLPSPELAFGRQRHIDVNGAVDTSISPAFGLRWELTPLLWSWGVHRRQSGWRFFVVDPIARLSGSLELATAFEYIGGHVDRVIARPGLRMYLPVAQRGEFLAVSLGTSAYSYEGFRVAYDVGAWILSGFLGFQVTVAPAHDPLAAIATLKLRFF